jgi:glutamyl-Q tRNA(Asp) synthetase
MAIAAPQPVLRFAPSPNGYLHLGHAYSALRNQQTAQKLGGRLLLRIEDIDAARCRKEYDTAILDDLAWLGIRWEEPVLRQAERAAVYARKLAELRERRVVYPCFCSRGDIAAATSGRNGWPHDPDGSPTYPQTCRHLDVRQAAARMASGERPAWRIDMQTALAAVGRTLTWREFGEGGEARDTVAAPALWGDAVVGRRDIQTSYHLAVVIDDAGQGVTDVVRGQDLYDATNLHRLLQALFDLPAPNYWHHDLLRDADGHKLSKSTQAQSIRSLRMAGMSAQSLRVRLGFA